MRESNANLGGRVSLYIHRLVASTFLKPHTAPAGTIMEVHHKALMGDKSKNELF